MNSESQTRDQKLVCFCNKVSRATIESVVSSGRATNLESIYDACGAGVGPCGGSCRDTILGIIRKHDAEPTSESPKTVSISEEMVQAISLFNRRYYWETHEVLEEVWLQESGQQKLFTQALIQSAAALYHVLNANPAGVIKLAETALQKFQNVPLEKYGVDCRQLISSLKFYQLESREILAKDKTGFDYSRLPSLSHGMSMTTSGSNAGE